MTEVGQVLIVSVFLIVFDIHLHRCFMQNCSSCNLQGQTAIVANNPAENESIKSNFLSLFAKHLLFIVLTLNRVYQRH